MLDSIPTVERDERQKQLIADAAEMAADVDDGSRLIGYTLLSFYSDGSTRTAGCRPNRDGHRIGETMFEAWALASLQNHFSYGNGVRAASDVLNGDA